MRTIWQDLRYSARLLRKHPGFTVTAVGVLTLGIGVNAGVFGIINGLMIRPLAGADAPGEVVGVFSKDRTAARDYRPFSYPGFSDVRDAGGPFAHLAGHTVALAGVTENSTTRQATVDIVTTGFFETLGVQPVYGRDFTIDEERPGTAPRSVIVSYKVWERSGLDRGVLKETVRINGQDFAIVGVAPQHFTGTTATLGAEYYMPVGVHDAIASDVAFGLWPALRLSRPDLLSSLKDRAGEVSGKIAGRITVRDALVTAQLALSLALLVLSGLFVRGAAAGASANPGFDVGQLAIAQIEPNLGGYDAASEVSASDDSTIGGLDPSAADRQTPAAV